MSRVSPSGLKLFNVHVTVFPSEANDAAPLVGFFTSTTSKNSWLITSLTVTCEVIVLAISLNVSDKSLGFVTLL